MKKTVEQPLRRHRHERAIEAEILGTVEDGVAGVFYKDAKDGTFVRITNGTSPIKVHYNGPAGKVMNELISAKKIEIAPTPQAYADDRTGFRIGKRAPQMS